MAAFFEYTNFKDDLIEYKCLCCNKDYQQKLDEKLKELFFHTYKYSNHDNNKFTLLLPKGVYSYERWMIGKNFMEHHYVKNNILLSLKFARYY